MSFIRPVNAKVTGSFQSHVDRKSVNPGVDYGCPKGTDIHAPADGRIVDVIKGIKGAGGRVIKIAFDNGYNGDFLHLSQLLVAKGDKVKQGQVIAKSGGSGLGKENGYPEHLHFSIRKGGKHLQGAGNLDFEKLLETKPTTKAKTFTPLKRGDSGAAVLELQKKLGIKPADGIFGNQTHGGVVNFQRKHKLTADGIVGEQTWRKINE